MVARKVRFWELMLEKPMRQLSHKQRLQVEFTTGQVARLFNVSNSTIVNICKSHRIGYRDRYNRIKLNQFHMNRLEKYYFRDNPQLIAFYETNIAN